MIKIKEVSEALPGDFVRYQQRLSVILSVNIENGTHSIGLDDGRVIADASSGRMEIFRMESFNSDPNNP